MVVNVVIDEKASIKVVTFGELSNISDGIDEILVPLIKEANEIISSNPLYPPTALNDALDGIDVILTHP
jgi:hypothetical protein